MDKTCVITLWNAHGWHLDELMLTAVMERVGRLAVSAKTIDIYPQERTPADAAPYRNPGQCEWVMRVSYSHNSFAMTIGCVQRSTTSEVEFHS